MTAHIGVVGAGPAGLAAAFRLQQAGWSVRLFEANDYLGGRMATSERDGFLIDHGATIMSGSYASVLGIVREAGLESELLECGTTLGILRDGEIHCFDARRVVRDALQTRLLTSRSKVTLARLAFDVLRARKHLDYGDLSKAAAFDTQSAGDYARTRLNAEILEYLIEPAVGGLVGAWADEYSVVNLLFAAEKFLATKYLVFRRGMGSYAALLGRRFDVELGARVQAVEERGDEVVLNWRSSDGTEHTESLAGCVVATPAPAAGEMLPGLDSWRADFLRRVRYSKSFVPSLALSRPPAGVPATYVMVPRSSSTGILSLLMEHNKAPGRVPAGKGMVTVYTDGAWAEEMKDDSDDVVTKKVAEAVDRLLPGTADDLEFTVVRRWDKLGPLCPPGYWREMAHFQEIRKSSDRLIQLAGDYFGSASINSASATGERAASELLTALT